MSMSKLESQINYKNLEWELQGALRADNLYQLQNDAKLRAIEQNVPTYEDFRQMVNAAHLKPFKCNNSTYKIKGLWNPVINNNHPNTTMELIQLKRIQPDKNKNSYILEDKLANTCEEFIHVWKTIEEDERKFKYLRELRHILQEKIFRTEIPSMLFAELINICSKAVVNADNIMDILEILSILSKCNRFHLTIRFMCENEREMCTRLFHDLDARIGQDNVQLGDAIKLLRSSYRVISTI
ncbi:dynein axonemal assembly factor 19 [Calliopsis andreniformis]|uniref:dynein axonemal assembly factor 19 n=1 Tax=Calliopsis andreniformis TaxID=337506 RepID=UPI003FCCF7F8